MSDELKACPFCGSDEIGASVNFRDGKLYDYIVCPTANCYVGGQHTDPDELARWWNTRPSITEEKIEEMVREMAYAFIGPQIGYYLLDTEKDTLVPRLKKIARKHLIGEVK